MKTLALVLATLALTVCVPACKRTPALATGGASSDVQRPGWKSLAWGSSQSEALARYKPRWNQPELLTIDDYNVESDVQTAGAPWRLLLYYKDDHLTKTSVSRTGTALELDSQKMREELAKHYGSPILQQKDKMATTTLFKDARASVKLDYTKLGSDEVLGVDYTPPQASGAF